MGFKDAFDYFTYLLSVPKCVSCNEKLTFKEKALCRKCSEIFEEVKNRNCSRCSKLLSECVCVSRSLATHFVKGVVKCFRYNVREENHPANALIYSLKRDNRDDVLEKCTYELCRALKNNLDLDSNFIITNVPRRKRAIVEYGIDHSALLAKSIAKRLDLRYVPLLKSNTKNEQKSLSSEDRLKNIDFELISCENLKGNSVIIVDDIITTGASIGAASSLVRSLGTKSIYAASLAIAYKDDLY